MKRTASGLAVVIVAVVLWSIGSSFLAEPQAQQGATGRYQVVPTTNELYSVLLVDTTTGETWTTCLSDELEGQRLDDQRVKNWCSVVRTSSRAATGSGRN